jgi:hypothetical protein
MLGPTAPKHSQIPHAHLNKIERPIS